MPKTLKPFYPAINMVLSQGFSFCAVQKRKDELLPLSSPKTSHEEAHDTPLPDTPRHFLPTAHFQPVLSNTLMPYGGT